MAYPTLSDYNTSKGIQVVFQYAAETVPIFTPLVLFALFVVTCLGVYYSQIRLRGIGDFWASFATAGYLTVLVAYLMSLMEGIINLATMSICVVVAIAGTLILFITHRT